MNARDKLIVVASLATMFAAAPPLITGSLPLAIYGFGCVAAGVLLMIAVDAFERSRI